MKLFIPFTVGIGLLVACSNNPFRPIERDVRPPADTLLPQSKNSMDYTWENAHPNAQALMQEDFYWSTIEETGPFGSDDGWEAAQGFRRWRQGIQSLARLLT